MLYDIFSTSISMTRWSMISKCVSENRPVLLIAKKQPWNTPKWWFVKVVAKRKGGKPALCTHTECAVVLTSFFGPSFLSFVLFYMVSSVQCFTNRLAYIMFTMLKHNPAILVSFQLTIQLMALLGGSEAKCENVKMAENSVTSR